MSRWLPVILPVFFGLLSVVSACWPTHAMRVTRWFCQWLMQLIGLQGALQISEGAAWRCRIFNLCMIPVNGVLFWVGLRA